MHPTIEEYKKQRNVTYQDDQRGIWHVQARSSNPDFSGSHEKTTIGYVESTFSRAYKWTIQQSSFSMWSDADGYITLVPVQRLIG